MKRIMGFLAALMVLLSFTSCTDPVDTYLLDTKDILSTPENVLRTINAEYDYASGNARTMAFENSATVKSKAAWEMFKMGKDDYLKMILSNDISPLMHDVDFGVLVELPEIKSYSDATIDAIRESRPNLTRNQVEAELSKMRIKAIEVDRIDSYNARVWFAMEDDGDMKYYVLYCTRNAYGIFDTTAYGYTIYGEKREGEASLVNVEKTFDSTVYGVGESLNLSYGEKNGRVTHSSRTENTADMIKVYESTSEGETYRFMDKEKGGGSLDENGYFELFGNDYDLYMTTDSDSSLAVQSECEIPAAMEMISYWEYRLVLPMYEVSLTSESLESVGFKHIPLFEYVHHIVAEQMPSEDSESIYYSPDRKFNENMYALSDWAIKANEIMNR